MRKGFCEFLKSKQQLIQDLQSAPTTKITYTVKKYVKMPLLEQSNQIMLGLKPNDQISIIWEFDLNGNAKGCKQLLFNNMAYTSDKSIARIQSWLITNTKLDDTNWFV